MIDTFRDRLRIETRPAHDRLDHLISTLDVATRDGLAAFFQIHLACFSHLGALPDLASATSALLQKMNGALAEDLKTLGAQPAKVRWQSNHFADPLAVAYVVGGSRLGSKILKKRWAAASDPAVRNAHHYFELPGEGPYWKSICADLAKVSTATPDATRIVADTDLIFDMFTAAFQDIKREAALGNAT